MFNQDPYNWGNGTGTSTYMDIDTGDMTVVNHSTGSIFHISNKKDKVGIFKTVLQ